MEKELEKEEEEEEEEEGAEEPFVLLLAEAPTTATTQPNARASAASADRAPKAVRETSVPARSARTSWSIGEAEEEEEEPLFLAPLKVTTPAVAQSPSLLWSPERVDFSWSKRTNWAPAASTRDDEEEDEVKEEEEE